MASMHVHTYARLNYFMKGRLQNRFYEIQSCVRMFTVQEQWQSVWCGGKSSCNNSGVAARNDG
eukprot:scaffold17116_cov20-Tisochrysis_lutea.AAC.1